MNFLVIFMIISGSFAAVSYRNYHVVKFRIENEEQLKMAIELGGKEGVSSQK